MVVCTVAHCKTYLDLDLERVQKLSLLVSAIYNIKGRCIL